MPKTEIPTTHEDILNKRCFANVATIRPDGRLSCNPVSIIWDGDHVHFSSREETKKVRNLRADSRIALCIVDPDDPSRYIEIRGTAVVEPDDDRSFVNQIAMKYMDVEEYPYDPPNANRVQVSVHAEQVSVPAVPGGSQ